MRKRIVLQYKLDISRIGCIGHPLHGDGIQYLESPHKVKMLQNLHDEDLFLSREEPEDPGGTLYKVRNGTRQLIASHDMDTTIFMLNCFLDQYRGNNKPLPAVEPKPYSKRTSEYILKAMEIIRDEMSCYDDFVNRIKRADRELGKISRSLGLDWRNIIDWETFNGKESIDEGRTAISGAKVYNEGYGSPGIIRQVNNDTWDVYHRERSSIDLMFRVYGESNLYDYLMDNHIYAIT